jgi:hypothetical protein
MYRREAAYFAAVVGAHALFFAVAGAHTAIRGIETPPGSMARNESIVFDAMKTRDSVYPTIIPIAEFLHDKGGIDAYDVDSWCDTIVLLVIVSYICTPLYLPRSIVSPESGAANAAYKRACIVVAGDAIWVSMAFAATAFWDRKPHPPHFREHETSAWCSVIQWLAPGPGASNSVLSLPIAYFVVATWRVVECAKHNFYTMYWMWGNVVFVIVTRLLTGRDHYDEIFAALYLAFAVCMRTTLVRRGPTKQRNGVAGSIYTGTSNRLSAAALKKLQRAAVIGRVDHPMSTIFEDGTIEEEVEQYLDTASDTGVPDTTTEHHRPRSIRTWDIARPSHGGTDGVIHLSHQDAAELGARLESRHPESDDEDDLP